MSRKFIYVHNLLSFLLLGASHTWSPKRSLSKWFRFDILAVFDEMILSHSMSKSSSSTRSNHLHSKTVNMLGVWEGFRFMPRCCSRSSGRSLALVLPIINCV